MLTLTPQQFTDCTTLSLSEVTALRGMMAYEHEGWVVMGFRAECIAEPTRQQPESMYSVVATWGRPELTVPGTDYQIYRKMFEE